MAKDSISKVFAGRDRYKKMMEWEIEHPEYRQKYLDAHNKKITILYIRKDAEEEPDE